MFGGAHNIHTPQLLVEDILSKVSLQGNILVLFNVEFVISLVYNYNINPTNITFYSDHENKTKLMQRVGVNNVITTLDINMKFDVAILNPPYNDETTSNKVKNDQRRNKNTYLHPKFVAWALANAEQAAIICPLQEWFIGRGSKEREQVFKSGKLKAVNLMHAKQSSAVFGATTGDLGVLYLGNTGSAVDVYVDGQFISQQPNNAPIVFAGDASIVSLIRRLSTGVTVDTIMEVSTGPKRTDAQQYYCSSGYKFVETIGVRDDALVIHNIDKNLLDPASPLYVTSSKKYSLEKNAGMFRVGLNQGGERQRLSAMKVVPAGVYTSYSINTLVCNSEVEAQNLITYLNTTFVKAIIFHTHHTASNGKTTFKHVPLVDLTRSWTDAELYAHFNLTQDEIDLIEATVK